VTLTRGRCVDGEDPIVGISMVPNFPYPISIESGDVGGPSAGMMYALGLYDLLTPGDLTDGRIVAGTGTIDLEGKVGPIGGIGDKIVAAQGAGADVFLVPDGDLNGASAASDGSMQIVAISTLQEALTFLGGVS
jgi:PDZ domain-containing protein